MGRLFANICETVGRTPVVKIVKLAPSGVNLYVKIEAFNPMGSVKDRPALGVIEDAERSGSLKASCLVRPEGAARCVFLSTVMAAPALKPH